MNHSVEFPIDLLYLVLVDGANDHTPLCDIQQIGGGDMSVAVRVETAQGVYFAKWQTPDIPPLSLAEGKGLLLLGSADSGLVVPQVIGLADSDEGMLLLLEWLETAPATSHCAAALGRGLARLHRHISEEQYGLQDDNYIGSSLQINDWCDDWPTFFGEQRLGVMAEWLTIAKRWPARRARLLERLLKRLPDLLPHDPPPSLLHGDLWGGNWLALADGRAALIDPATYFGDRETDLAMTRLFEGFPPRFYDAYNAEWPLESGATERFPIYNLYHLMNHLLLFGERYGANVDRLLGRYA